ncbi:MAG: outer membrane protein assembly factor BamC [Rugosibacter sp.]|nr:MAG: outer membrane protein assembly factor BamC [Rugosibacter sp.]TBR09432.1 MAG: outer membrane protein assembly factor BamC [Rugosibacter sp.]
MKINYLPLVLLLVGVIAGCSGPLIETKKIEYKSAGKAKLPSLEIPPDLTQPSRDERYVVPDVAGSKGPATYSAYANERGEARAEPSTDVLPQVDKMRIERAGTQRWLVVSGSPEKLWPVVKEFWQEIGLLVNVELPEAGIMETDWAENRAKLPQDFIRSTLGKVFDDVYSTAERDKYRTRLEKGAEPDTTEIYISHRGMIELYISEGKTETRWQPRPADPELEAEMLRRLMVRLGVQETRAKTLIAADQSSERAKLSRAADGSGALVLEEPFDRAWRRVGLALDRIGFTVEDRDRSQGLYYVRYVDPEADNRKKDEPGFLSKMMFWKSHDADKDKPVQAAQYRIQVKKEGDTNLVQLLTREGGVDSSTTSKRIIGLLHEQLK